MGPRANSVGGAALHHIQRSVSGKTCAPCTCGVGELDRTRLKRSFNTNFETNLVVPARADDQLRRVARVRQRGAELLVAELVVAFDGGGIIFMRYLYALVYFRKTSRKYSISDLQLYHTE